MNDPGPRRRVRPAIAFDRDTAAHSPRGNLAALTIGAIGVVYGDIGTSPLYAIDQIFIGPAGVAPTPDNVVGAISLAIWTIILIVAIKYALLVLRAENDGEGGVFALYGLLHKYKDQGTKVLLWSLMLGAGLLLGDGMITPAISVLSAVEGLEVATPAFAPYVIPITAVLLTGLFAIQFKGASGIGVVFGPVLLVWFVVIAALGAVAIAKEPAILAAFNPVYGASFLVKAGLREAVLILSVLILVVTGGEAMYADLGHFGARPIRIGWFTVVFPALRELSRSGRLSAFRRGGRGRQAVLQPRAGAAVAAARRAGDDRRIAGADIRCLLAGLAGDRARAVSPPRRLAHPSRSRRTDLYSRGQLGTLYRLRRTGGCVRLIFGAGRGLRARRRRRDADYLARHVRDRAALLAMEFYGDGAGMGSDDRAQRRLSGR
jgi:K+ potassium transporter